MSARRYRTLLGVLLLIVPAGCHRAESERRDEAAEAATLLLAGAVAAVPFLGGEFLPDFRESNFVVFMAGKPDSSLRESVRIGTRVAHRLREVPGVVSVAQQIGRADLSEDTWGPNISEIWIVIDDRADYHGVLRGIRGSLEEVPGHVFQVKQFLRERMDEVLTGTTADIVVRIVGPELEVLRLQAGRIAESIEDVPGVEDLRAGQQVDVPQIRVELRPRDAAAYGFSVGRLHQDVETLLRGTRVGQVYEEDRVIDVILRGSPAVRSNPAILGELLVDSPTNEKIPLRAVAAIDLVDAPNAINRELAGS
ncbi:MAG: efflux RND transporter permease subunit [Planctomycetales bacterium]